MARCHYYRISTHDQSIEAQRAALGGNPDMEFADEGVSGSVLAADRPGFAKLLAYVRSGDEIVVYAVDRLGRDALDVQATVRKLLKRGVIVNIHGLGQIVGGVGELILAVMAQLADMERHRIAERCEAGRTAARASLRETGKTHRGKASLGRPRTVEPADVATWRTENKASISKTAEHFGVSKATVSRACMS